MHRDALSSRRARANPRILLIAAVLVVLGGIIYTRWQQHRRLQEPPQGSGTVEAVEVEVGPQVPGRIVALLVREGDALAKGQVIARLDDVELRAALAQALGQHEAALNNLRNLQQGSRAQQVAAGRAALRQAEAVLRGAERGVANAERGFAHATDVRQQAVAAAAQVRVLEAQLAAARGLAAAAAATAAGAEETLATAREAYAAVSDLQQQADAARGAADVAQASRVRAASALETARADFERVALLYEQGAVARREYDHARLALDTARTGLDAAATQVTATQAALRTATRALDDRLQARQAVTAAETSRKTTERQRQAAGDQVRQVEANLAGARLTLANAKTALNDRLQARTTRDAAVTARDTARHQVEVARQNLDLLLAGSTAASVRAAQGQLAAAAAVVTQARKRLQEAVVRAPVEGTVSTVVLYAGDTVSPGLPIVKVQDLDNAYVRIYLPFRQFGKVRTGQPASVVTDAIPGAAFRGTVTETATAAEFTPKNVETRDQRVQQVYWVKVRLTDPDRRLKPGMPARAEIDAN